MKLFLKIALMSCLFWQITFGADDEIKKSQFRVADAIKKISASEIRLFVYSLDPHDASRFEGKLPENSAKSFHWMPILGSVEIVPLEEKTNLLGTLARGVRENDGEAAMCFDPRHGLRVVTKSATNDFVICFECLQVQTYGFTPSSNFYVSGSPAATFNKILDKYKIKKAE
jgi:hypothetical protein